MWAIERVWCTRQGAKLFCKRCDMELEVTEYRSRRFLFWVMTERSPRSEYECPCCGSVYIQFWSGSESYRGGGWCLHRTEVAGG